MNKKWPGFPYGKILTEVCRRGSQSPSLSDHSTLNTDRQTFLSVKMPSGWQCHSCKCTAYWTTFT